MAQTQSVGKVPRYVTHDENSGNVSIMDYDRRMRAVGERAKALAGEKNRKLTAAELAISSLEVLVDKLSTDPFPPDSRYVAPEVLLHAETIRKFITDYRRQLERMCNARSLFTRVRETEVVLTKEAFNEARTLLGWDKVE